ncbi:MAG TPA: hypothetical protein VGS28_03625 [Candidatus Saccharimonadales bacterium]|nr:hypothetical protein [Candidatus Saccharimonadales bacterium]
MRFKEQASEAGVVSLFTVLFFTIMISILIVGFIEITNTEQGQSSQNNLSASSYYAAQSGLEDTKLALEQDYPGNIPALNTNVCTPPTGFSGNIAPAGSQLQIGYSCKLIDLNPQAIDVSLGDNVTSQWPLSPQGGPGGFNKIQISWHKISSEGYPAAVRAPGARSLPTYNNWDTNGYPAMLRVEIFGYPNAGSFTTNDLLNLDNVGFLNPTSGGAGNIPVGSLDPGTPVDAKCYTSGAPASYDGYACQATINVAPLTAGGGNNLYLRLKSLYDPNGTNAEIEMLQGGNVVNTNNTVANVDVTGYAGTVFSRIRAQVTLPGLNNAELLPEFALESGSDICKYLELSPTNEVSDGGCTVR